MKFLIPLFLATSSIVLTGPTLPSGRSNLNQYPTVKMGTVAPLSQIQDAPANPAGRPTPQIVATRGNVQRTGVYKTKAVRSLNGYVWKTKKLFTLEKKGYHTEDDVDLQDLLTGGYYSTAPIVANGLVYFTVYVGNGYLSAFDARTGEQKWLFKREHGAVSPPTIVGDTAYIRAGPRTIVALSTATGDEQWSFTAPAPAEPPKGLLYKVRAPSLAASPIVTDGLILFGTMEGDFYAVDAQKRVLKWGIHPGGVLAIPVSANGIAYLSSSLGYLYAIAINNGQEKWKIKVRAPLPVAGPGVVYYSDRETLYALDANTGQQKWKAKIRGKIGTALAVAEDVIYFGGLEDSLYAVAADTGQEKWRFKTKEHCDSPIIADDVVYTGSFEQFFAVDAKSGQQLWVQNEPKMTFSSPAIADGVAFTLAAEGFLFAIH